ncbi:MAG: Crp/Fnr family transcriptional regulator [Roseiflexus castenholzii]|uniref:Crp/Fnr family transcriptional regulator n=1 Tax=Roseiflexus castenholzii TaxID=120962 RepID=UPI000CB8DC82|nr:MAG: Crp/Fnr family transcriptional regulator [Roseiflexus castenholzii]
MTTHNPPPPVDVITDAALFPQLMSALRDIYGEIAAVQRPAGYVFYGLEDSGAEMYLLYRGRVRLYTISPEGRALTVLILDAPAVFGEVTLAEGAHHDSYAISVTPCTVGAVHRETLRRALRNQPSLALRFMTVMGQRLRAIERKLSDIAFKSVPQRLAAALLGLWTEQRDTPPTVRSTHQQLAELIGSHRETVTKALGDFRAAGLIRVDDDAIHLIDLVRLTHLAYS